VSVHTCEILLDRGFQKTLASIISCK
jgi:hypothetical protein